MLPQPTLPNKEVGCQTEQNLTALYGVKVDWTSHGLNKRAESLSTPQRLKTIMTFASQNPSSHCRNQISTLHSGHPGLLPCMNPFLSASEIFHHSQLVPPVYTQCTGSCSCIFFWPQAKRITSSASDCTLLGAKDL